MIRRHLKLPIETTPLHPGTFIRAEIIAPLNISVQQAADALGVHRVALSRLVNEQADLSDEMAIRLEQAFGADMEQLLQMQHEVNMARARQRRGEIHVPRFAPPLAEKQAKLF